MTETKSDAGHYSFIAAEFSDVPVPKFPVDRANDYIKFGDEDNVPEYMLYLLDKSSKHGAIVGSKADYIYGGGLKAAAVTDDTAKFITRYTSLVEKIIYDGEAFGGFYLQCIPTMGGGWAFYHMSFMRVRVTECKTRFKYKTSWIDSARRTEVAKIFPAFNPTVRVVSVLQYKDYRPGNLPYSLPGFWAACNWIESDVEVSKHTLTNAKTGFSASKFINFYNGEPEEKAKQIIEEKFMGKFGGSQGRKMIIAFNNDPTKRPTVDDLGASDLTKEDFAQVDELISTNIYAGHKVTNSALFGIPPSNHSLGGNGGAELKVSYEIFKNTYVAKKKKRIEDFITLIARLTGMDLADASFTLIDIEPVGITFSEATIKEIAPREWLLDKLGVDMSKYSVPTTSSALVAAINSLSPLVANKVLEKMTPDEIRNIVGLTPVAGGNAIDAPAGAPKAPALPAPGAPKDASDMTNETLTNLSAKQMQHLNRIVREYTKGKVAEPMAMLLLQKSFGLTEDEAKTMLGIDDTTKFSGDENVIALFSLHGEDSGEFEVFEKRKITAFASEYDDLKGKIAAAIKKSPNATPAEIALEVGTKEEVVTQYISSLEKAAGTIKLPKFEVRYSYDKRPDVAGPDVIPGTRPFCRKMLGLNRLYTRADIQKISEYLGYDVMKRAGGFWNNDGEVEYHCRHGFYSQIVIKKNG